MSDLRERVEALANRVDVVAQSLCLSPGVDSERMDLLAIAKELRALLAPREEEPEGEPRADVSDALWCMECGYRRGTSSGQTRTKCPHGHGELVRARLLTLEQFSKIVPRPAPAAGTERETFQRLSMALTKGNAATWDEVIHAAEQAASTEGPGLRAAHDEAIATAKITGVLIRAGLHLRHVDVSALANDIVDALAARPLESASSLVSAAWDMLHAVEAADAAGELAENIGGELIDALRAALVEGEN